jgi:RimJ/RimL family protein N-acetyltransferase
MKEMNAYACLNESTKQLDNYSIVPLRYADRFDIMRWRNEQIYHLRQAKPLTEKDQDLYFNSVVSSLFEQEQPDQILFSYLEGDTCIGYGGLVHMNWIDRNAELSFIMNTALEKDYFQHHWSNFLQLIEQIAFKELSFHKIFTYAFDLRPHLYPIFEANGFKKEAELRDHKWFDTQFVNVVIHSKIKA